MPKENKNNLTDNINFRLSPELGEKILAYASKHDRSIGWICRQALMVFLHKGR